ncbi:DUF6048 family protein [Flavimarina sp. Hel_I_48]|uniref:DUF6048 family protein n=1 Tax=Flavimarina sp. Hel_I_48 TaxID=1392488 RepID=UPI0004DF0E42|nr:DUF6048 family protein [Flavimarina sp. Hel_I_48]
MTVSIRFLLYINIVLFALSASAQDIDTLATQKEQVTDTVLVEKVPERYGLRVGIDLSTIIRSALDDNYKGLSIVGDFRIKDNYYLAAEIGTETKDAIENSFDATINGSYIKAGFNYNAYENWTGMSNLIYAGVRVGYATFNTDLNSYTIYTTNTYFEPDVRDELLSFDGLSGAWLEAQLGVQARLFNNFYLGVNLQLKSIVSQKEPEGFGNLYIPGFNKVTTDNKFGAGYGYTLTYLIPIYKK